MDSIVRAVFESCVRETEKEKKSEKKLIVTYAYLFNFHSGSGQFSTMSFFFILTVLSNYLPKVLMTKRERERNETKAS